MGWAGARREMRICLLAAASALLILATGACRESPGPERNEPAGSTTESHPFRVKQPPDGFRLVQAGRGTRAQAWGDDTFGSEEPVTLLAPAGQGPGGPDEIRVSFFGYTGYQGALSQGSYGYVVNEDRLQEFEIDGQTAIHSPGFDRRGIKRPSDLVVDMGNGIGLRVTKAGGSRDELVAVARAAEPFEDHVRAPVVRRPPAGLAVVGSADADVAFSLEGTPVPYTDELPGGTRAHSAVWAMPITPEGAWRAESGCIVVTTLPGISLGLDAAAAAVRRPFDQSPGPDIERIEVAGRPGVVMRFPGSSFQGPHRVVVTSTAGGDLLTVAGHGTGQPSEEELVVMATSVEQATPAEWDALVVQGRGGPGLAADAGAVELQRGKVRYRPAEPSGMTGERLLSRPA